MTCRNVETCVKCKYFPLNVNIFSADVARSLDVLDSVIGEFDDGFLSDAEPGGARGQLQLRERIDRRMFDEIHEADKGDTAHLGGVQTGDRGEVPGPGTVQQAKRQYLDNLDRSGQEARSHTSKIGEARGKERAGGRAGRLPSSAPAAGARAGSSQVWS